MCQGHGTQDHVIGIALPDAIQVAHADIDALARIDFSGNIDQHAVAQIHRIIQAQQDQRRTVLLRVKVEDALAGHGGVGILAQRRQRIGFHAPRARRGDKWIDVAGR